MATRVVAGLRCRTKPPGAIVLSQKNEKTPVCATQPFPWDAPWWVQRAVTPRRYCDAEWFDSTPTDQHAEVGKLGKAAGSRCQRFCGFDPRPPHRVAVGKLVKPLGSDPRDFEGSTPSRDTMGTYANWYSGRSQVPVFEGSTPSVPTGR